MVRPVKAIAVILLAFSAERTVAAESGAEKAVTLFVYEQRGGHAYGTGAIVSAQGEVLTCYHVIEGARKVEAVFDDKFYSVSIESIDPEHDLAWIRLENIHLPTRFFPLATSLPEGLSRHALRIYGYIAGLDSQSLEARATQDDYVHSGKLRGLRSERLFKQTNIDLIPLDANIVTGLSGAPVVSNGVVVGILSGSLMEGGAIAWAIPSKYADRSHMLSVPQSISSYKWPALALMDPASWKTLRKQVTLSEDVLLALDAYSKALAKFESVNDKRKEVGTTFMASVDNTIALLQSFPREKGLSHLSRNQKAEYRQSVNELDVVIADMKVQLDSDTQPMNAAKEKLLALSEATEKFVRQLPPTPRNCAILSRTREGSQTVAERMNNLTERLTDREQAVKQLGTVMSSYGTSRVGDFENRYATLKKMASIYFTDVDGIYNEYAETFRSIGFLYRGLMDTDVDERQANEP